MMSAHSRFDTSRNHPSDIQRCTHSEGAEYDRDERNHLPHSSAASYRDLYDVVDNANCKQHAGL